MCEGKGEGERALAPRRLTRPLLAARSRVPSPQVDYWSDHVRMPNRVMLGTESFPGSSFQMWNSVWNDTWVLGDFICEGGRVTLRAQTGD